MAASAERFLQLNDVITTFNCLACHQCLANPQIMANCGHCICESCFKECTGRGLVCPLCVNVENTRGNRLHPRVATTNFQMKKLSEMASEVLKCAALDGCLHLPLVNSPIYCRHCGASLCQPCYTRHLEWVRLETLLFGSQFRKRAEDVATWLANDPVSSFQKAVDTKAEKARRDVDGYCTQLEKRFKRTLEEVKALLLVKVETLANSEKKKFEDILKEERRVIPVDEIVANLNNLAETSPLHFNGDNVCALFDDVVQGDEELNRFENMKIWAEKAMFAVNSGENGLKEGLQALKTECDVSCIFPSGGNFAVPTIPSQIHHAAIVGYPAALKSIFNSLPPICRKFAVEHCDTNTKARTTPLLDAVRLGRLETVSYLVKEEHADLKAKTDDDTESTALHLATQHCRYDVVKLLLESDPSLINEKDGHGNTALHYAVKLKGSFPIVSCLIEHGAKIDQENRGQYTVLHTAARYCQDPAVFKLLLSKSEMNLVTKRGPAGDAAIHMACSSDNVDVVKCLLELDPNMINLPGEHGYFPFHTAAGHDAVKVLEFLLNKNPAMIESRAMRNITPLAVALLGRQGGRVNNKQAVNFLMRHGADACASVVHHAYETVTCLDLAVLSHDNVECLKIMLAVKPNLINAKNIEGQTPLDFARLHRKRDCVDFLLKALSSTIVV